MVDPEIQSVNDSGKGDHESKTHEYLATIFRRCVASIVGSRGATTNQATFDYIVMLAETRMHELFHGLADLAHLQRRNQPNLEDIALLLTQHNINVFDLEQEMSLKSDLTTSLNTLQFDPELEPLADAAMPFFDAQVLQVQKIVPARKTLPVYAPEWAPPLPPDHTYKATPKYTNKISDLRVLREQLVEESKLAERALQRLLGSDGSESSIEFTQPTHVGNGIAAGQRSKVSIEVPNFDRANNDVEMEHDDDEDNHAIEDDEDEEDEEKTRNYITIVDRPRESVSNDIEDKVPASDNAVAAPESPKDTAPKMPILKIKVKGDGENKPLSLKISFNKKPVAATELAPVELVNDTAVVVPEVQQHTPTPIQNGNPFKRPRVDIVALAHERAKLRTPHKLTPDPEPLEEGGTAASSAGTGRPEGPEAKQGPQPQGQSLEQQFEAALKSIKGQ